MAVVPLNSFYTGNGIQHNNSLEESKPGFISTDYSNRDEAAKFGLYKTDKITREDFPKSVGVTNPVRETMTKSDGYAEMDLRDHAYEWINKFKVCEIAMGSAGSTTSFPPSADQWGKWRTQNPAGIPVFGNVFLFPDDKVFQFSYTNDFGEAWESVDPGGLGAKVSQLAELARSAAAVMGKGELSSSVAGKLMSRYKKAPAWTGTAPIKIGSNLKFTFQFGQAGVFSGEHEVVRPILALASLWVPIKTGTESYYRGVLPTPPFMMAMALKTAVEGLPGILGQAFGEGIGIQTLTNAEQAIIQVQETAIKKSLESAGSRALYIRMGRMVMGPYIVKDVNWDFDFTQTDEYGFPSKGSITFGGLESSIMPDPRQITYMWNMGTETANTEFETDQAVNDLYVEKQTDKTTENTVKPANNASGQSNPDTIREKAAAGATAGRSSAAGRA
jgi:hypothetical protein